MRVELEFESITECCRKRMSCPRQASMLRTLPSGSLAGESHPQAHSETIKIIAWYDYFCSARDSVLRSTKCSVTESTGCHVVCVSEMWHEMPWPALTCDKTEVMIRHEPYEMRDISSRTASLDLICAPTCYAMPMGCNDMMFVCLS